MLTEPVLGSGKTIEKFESEVKGIVKTLRILIAVLLNLRSYTLCTYWFTFAYIRTHVQIGT